MQIYTRIGLAAEIDSWILCETLSQALAALVEQLRSRGKIVHCYILCIYNIYIKIKYM